jgi:hypothetical protein
VTRVTNGTEGVRRYAGRHGFPSSCSVALAHCPTGSRTHVRDPPQADILRSGAEKGPRKEGPRQEGPGKEGPRWKGASEEGPDAGHDVAHRTHPGHRSVLRGGIRAGIDEDRSAQAREAGDPRPAF